MKKQIHFMIFFVLLFIFIVTLSARADGPVAPPPPPEHSMNGNQGTGCPIDRQDGILIALCITLGYAGFVLYHRGKIRKDTSITEK